MAALDAPVTSSSASSSGRRLDVKDVLKNKALARLLVSAAKLVKADAARKANTNAPAGC